MQLAKRVLEIEESRTLTLAQRADELKAQGHDIVSLTAGEPDFDTPAHIKEAALEAMRKGFTKYTPVSGIPELKKAITEKLQRDNGVVYDPSHIVVSCGAKHAIYNILCAILNESDEALIPAPYWTSYPEMVKLVGAQPVIVGTSEQDGFKLKIDHLERYITDRTKAIILNSPCNPTGTVYTHDDLAELADLLTRRQIYIISDEIYERIIFDNYKHHSIASLNSRTKDYTIIVNGFSKTYAMTGWRLGYCAGPRDIMNACTKIQSQVTSNPSSIAQYAACTALRSDQGFTDNMAREYQKRRDFFLSRLSSISRVKCVKPAGAFYIFLNISGLFDKEISDSVSLCNALLEKTQLACVDGEAFGSKDHIRLSFATSVENLEKAVQRLQTFVEGLR